MSPATVVRGAVATPIEELELDEAFVKAEARSRAGQDSEIWCRRDRAGRAVAYRVVVCDQREALGQAWEQIALFFAVGSDAGPKALSELTAGKNGPSLDSQDHVAPAVALAEGHANAGLDVRVAHGAPRGRGRRESSQPENTNEWPGT